MGKKPSASLTMLRVFRRYCQVDEIPADRPPRCCDGKSSLTRHIAYEIRGFARNLTVSMISLPDGVTCDTGGCR